MVMAQSLFMTLRARAPGCPIDVLAPAWSVGLLSRMPEVRHAIELPGAQAGLAIAARLRLARALRARGYQQAIVLPRSLKSALIPTLARIPIRTGYRGEVRYGLINDMRTLAPARLPQTVQRFVALGVEPEVSLPAPTPRPRLRVDRANADRLRKRVGLSLTRPIIGLAPGAEYGPAKRWPTEHYAELGMRLVDANMQVWLLGSPRDREMGERIATLAGGRLRNLCGETRLEDAVDLMAQTDLVVTNDSGAMHLAAALDRPLVVLYGSSSPRHTPPLSDRAAVLSLGLECSPCFEHTCPLGHYRCLTEMNPGRVFEAVKDGLAASGPRAV